jgi:hypothetical protein
MAETATGFGAHPRLEPDGNVDAYFYFAEQHPMQINDVYYFMWCCLIITIYIVCIYMIISFIIYKDW